MDPKHHAHGPSSLPRALRGHVTGLTARLSIIVIKTIATALAMFLIPRTIHTTVHCLNNVYEMLGRRAASPWETKSFYGNGVLSGLVIIAVLHYLLFRVGCHVLLDEDQVLSNENGRKTGQQRGLTWERILMRVIIPTFLYVGLSLMFWRVWRLSGDERELVRMNTVDMADDAGARLVWRDR